MLSKQYLAFALFVLIATSDAIKAHGHTFNLPLFLEKADSATQQKYIKIVTNTQTSPSEKTAEINSLVKSQSAEIQQAYAVFQAQQKAIKDQFGVSVSDELKLAAKAASSA